MFRAEVANHATEDEQEVVDDNFHTNEDDQEEELSDAEEEDDISSQNHLQHKSKITEAICRQALIYHLIKLDTHCNKIFSKVDND